MISNLTSAITLFPHITAGVPVVRYGSIMAGPSDALPNQAVQTERRLAGSLWQKAVHVAVKMTPLSYELSVRAPFLSFFLASAFTCFSTVCAFASDGAAKMGVFTGGVILSPEERYQSYKKWAQGVLSARMDKEYGKKYLQEHADENPDELPRLRRFLRELEEAKRPKVTVVRETKTRLPKQPIRVHRRGEWNRLPEFRGGRGAVTRPLDISSLVNLIYGDSYKFEIPAKKITTSDIREILDKIVEKRRFTGSIRFSIEGEEDIGGGCKKTKKGPKLAFNVFKEGDIYRWEPEDAAWESNGM